MKFKIVDAHVFWWPVEVVCPDPDKPGKTVTQSFTMQFQAMPADEADAMMKEINALPPEEQKNRQHEELLRVCKNWRDVTDEKGEQVPFSEETLKACLQYSWFNRGLYKAYMRSLAPDEARKGN
ncbi:hypothetical protein EN932_27070 [Mesorhizobium sp. M7A.F.Ca.US.002.01.1.1]|uniref:hypothetical protein n=1 Tax=Mesorhizobium sp. M7A.F.Ca.US.002.01.1.1 TaxID=2496700 RepID=UPI000FD2D71A|nr:hypothetical protein [Mesorhizobium sp. M7A.F.Ca.US.002.01.1.1]RVA07638.1 hypothetical protein EN932_27070 [Mesorhizobium sp. M7A.F.Ca.US.002.01.1.1]